MFTYWFLFLPNLNVNGSRSSLLFIFFNHHFLHQQYINYLEWAELIFSWGFTRKIVLSINTVRKYDSQKKAISSESLKLKFQKFLLTTIKILFITGSIQLSQPNSTRHSLYLFLIMRHAMMILFLWYCHAMLAYVNR